MATIQVPGPAKDSFNKNRPVSDLLLSQVKHFQHVEATLHPSKRTGVSPGNVLTENTAAQYIAQMTEILRGRTSAPSAAGGPILVAHPVKAVAKPTQPSQGIPLAASADPTPKTKPGSPPKKAASAKEHRSPGSNGKKP